MVGPFGLYPKGTMKVRALPLAKALAAAGHHVSMLIPPWDNPENSGVEWVEEGVKIINVRLPVRLPLLFHFLVTVRLVRRALQFHPDVVHCFKPKAYSGLVHFWLWWARRLKLVAGGLRIVVDEDDWERAWNDGDLYSWAERRFFSWQERWGLKHADRVVVASRALESLVSAEGVDPASIVYVPNGSTLQVMPGHVPKPEAVRMLWELSDSPVMLLYSRFIEFRLERVVTILRLVATSVPDVKLLVLGEGLHGEEVELDEMVTDAGLSHQTVFAGWVPVQQLPDHFAAANLAIFPYDDTLINRTKCSVKLVDLMASGVAVVADAVGQNKEYIVNGQSGILVAAEDDHAMARAAVSLLQDAALAERLGRGASLRVGQHFAWDQLASELEQAYR